MRILVAGATGAIGRRLVPQLIGRGHQVIGMTRRPAGARVVEGLGANPVVCDVFDEQSVRATVRRIEPEAIINQLTAIPDRIDPRRVARIMEPTNRIRREGTRALAAAGCEIGVSRFVSQSVAFAYVPGDGLAEEHDPLHRDVPVAFASMIRAVDDLERATLEAADGTGIVLRYGYFYGPGTFYARDGSFARDVRRRRVPLVGDATGVFSFIALDDAAAATAVAVETGAPGIYNIVDDDPAPMHVWLPEYARLLGAPPLRCVPKWLGRIASGAYGVYLTNQLRGASNAHAKVRLGWSPRHRSWREGFRALLAMEEAAPRDGASAALDASQSSLNDRSERS